MKINEKFVMKMALSSARRDVNEFRLTGKDFGQPTMIGWRMGLMDAVDALSSYSQGPEGQAARNEIRFLDLQYRYTKA